MSSSGICPTCGSRPTASGLCARCALGFELPDISDEADSAAEDQPLPSGTKVRYFGDYELLDTVGQQGGMVVVYRARQRSTGRIVALRMLKAEGLRSANAVRRFQAEIKAITSPDHSNILPVYEVGEHKGQHYYTMRFVEGGSLIDQMTRGK